MDYDYEDEDFSWYKHQEMIEQTYFVMVNCERKTIKKGEQVFYCYGKRSNAFLLLNYGFCIPDNKYDSFSFRVKLGVQLQKSDLHDYSQIVVTLKEDDYACSEEIRLKYDQLNDVLLGYLRTIFRDYFRNKHGIEHLLLTKPKNI